MDFSKLANLSIGLAAFLGGLWLVLQIVKSLKRNGNQSNKSGERSTEEWEGKMRDIARKANEEMMQDMRQLLTSRNEELRRIVREELERK